MSLLIRPVFRLAVLKLICQLSFWSSWGFRVTFRFRHSFGSPTVTFCVNGCSASRQICVLPQFCTSDFHFWQSGLGEQTCVPPCFATVFGRPTLFTFRVKGCFASLRISVSLELWTSDEHEVTGGIVSRRGRPNPPRAKKKLKRSSIFVEQPFSAAFLSTLPQ